MTERIVCDAEDLQSGDRVVLTINGTEISVFNVDGEYHACANWCPHQSGPVCEGLLTGTTAASFDRETLEYEKEWIKEGRIVICPWHGWEFDIETGKATHDADIRLVSYPVREEEGSIVVDVGGAGD
jgi:nitrite reductase (NADH) small subunit